MDAGTVLPQVASTTPENAANDQWRWKSDYVYVIQNLQMEAKLLKIILDGAAQDTNLLVDTAVTIVDGAINHHLKLCPIALNILRLPSSKRFPLILSLK